MFWQYVTKNWYSTAWNTKQQLAVYINLSFGIQFNLFWKSIQFENRIRGDYESWTSPMWNETYKHHLANLPPFRGWKPTPANVLALQHFSSLTCDGDSHYVSTFISIVGRQMGKLVCVCVCLAFVSFHHGKDVQSVPGLDGFTDLICQPLHAGVHLWKLCTAESEMAPTSVVENTVTKQNQIYWIGDGIDLSSTQLYTYTDTRCFVFQAEISIRTSCGMHICWSGADRFENCWILRFTLRFIQMESVLFEEHLVWCPNGCNFGTQFSAFCWWFRNVCLAHDTEEMKFIRLIYSLISDSLTFILIHIFRILPKKSNLMTFCLYILLMLTWSQPQPTHRCQWLKFGVHET